jgi:hypothetical protein
MATGVLAVSPFGANVSQVGNSQRAPADAPQNHSAIAGNVTELTISGVTVTTSWQGYYGNVSGTIVLADVNDNAMYNWSLASPEGEVFASTNSSINWNYIQCLNYTSAGTYASDTAQAGSTSFFGTNLLQLETAFGIVSDDVDGVNETFTLTGTHDSGQGLAHDLFYVNNFQFSAGECISTHVRSANGAVVDGMFQEVLLYEPSTSSVVFTALLDEEGPAGFDVARHDFEMLVLENGHGTDTATTTYFFYVELE